MKIIADTVIRNWSEKIFSVTSFSDFNALAMEIFRFQYRNNPIYHQYVDLTGVNAKKVNSIYEIPFLPVELFKKYRVTSGTFKEEAVFVSSGTTSAFQARHFVADLGIYEQSFFSTFEKFSGNIDDLCILGLLPSYLEREGSSLIYMVDRLMKRTRDKNSGFYLYENDKLYRILERKKQTGKRTVLFGVSFALLDFAEQNALDFPELIIVETGGMKGRRKEIVREEMYGKLKKAFNVTRISSEYGMTELLSQAYAVDMGMFHCPPWMQVFIGDIYDPFENLPAGKSGNIKIIDLANVFSCSFLATQDLGIMHHDNAFEVLGRIDTSDIRGCSLLL